MLKLYKIYLPDGNLSNEKYNPFALLLLFTDCKTSYVSTLNLVVGIMSHV